jgi:hypothetical protein
VRPGGGLYERRRPDCNQSMNFVGSTYVIGFMIANGYFGSIAVLP